MTGASGGHRSRKRTSRRAAVLAPVLLALMAPLGGVVTPAVAAAPPRLAGTTAFTASKSSITTVRVPRAASLTVDKTASSPNVALTASGRFAGFVFTALRRADRPSTLTVLQSGMCAEPGCRPGPAHRTFEYVWASSGLVARKTATGTQVTLPAGDYAVRAIADGAPVRLTLRLSGLSGSTSIRVTRPNPVTLRTDASASGVAGIDPLRDVGVTHRFRKDLGLMMYVLLREYEPHVRSHTGVCTYLNKKSPTGRYHPTCPEAEDEFVYEVGYPTLHYYGAAISGDISMTAGAWTRGFYLTGAGGKSALTAVTLWVDLT